LRINGALDALVRWSPLPLLIAVGALTYVKVTPPGGLGPGTRGVIVSCLGLAVLTTLVVVVRTWRATAQGEEGALALDRHHALEDRLTSALAFGRRLQGERASRDSSDDDRLGRSFMELAIADAVSRAPRLDPRGAVPLRLPAQWGAPLSLVLGLGILGTLEVQRPQVVVPELPPPTDRVTLFADDVELLREVAEELERTAETPEALANVREFNRLVEDLAAERLDRREAFARLDALEREIRGSGRELESLEQDLKAMGEELERAALSRPAGEALRAERLADAEQALRDLAERLRRREDPPSKAELEELRKSLERASEALSSKGDPQGTSAERSSLEAERQRLLKKQAEGTATDADRRALERTERQLERLGRRRGDSASQGHRDEPLSELDRQLAQAARELAEAQGRSSDFIDQGADAVSRVKQKQLSQKEKEQLLERMREMRDMLRQQKGGEQQKEWAERMRRLQQKARGGQQGDGGEGKPRPGSAGPGQPSGVTLGPDGQPIPMPNGSDAGQAPGRAGSGEGDQPGGNGPQPGGGHDPDLRGDEASSPQGQTEDVMAVAPDTGEGTASSEVIYSAAQRGFASGEYKRIFTEYETVAEDVIEREGIPPGYRSHVRRYFQLIRPRE